MLCQQYTGQTLCAKQHTGSDPFCHCVTSGEVEEGLDVVEMIQGTATGRADRPVDDIEMRMIVIE